MESLDELQAEKRSVNNKILSVKSEISSIESEERRLQRDFPNFEIQQRHFKKTISRAKIDLDKLEETRIKEEEKVRMLHEEKGNLEKKMSRLFVGLRDVESREKRMEETEQRNRQY